MEKIIEKLTDKFEVIDERVRKIENKFFIGIGLLAVLGISGGFFGNHLFKQKQYFDDLSEKYESMVKKYEEINVEGDEAKIRYEELNSLGKSLKSELDKTFKGHERRISNISAEKIDELIITKNESLKVIDNKTKEYVFGIANVSEPATIKKKLKYYNFDKSGFYINYDINVWSLRRRKKFVYIFTHHNSMANKALSAYVFIKPSMTKGIFDSQVEDLLNGYKSVIKTSEGVQISDGIKIPFSQWKVVSDDSSFGKEAIAHFRFYRRDSNFAYFIWILGEKNIFEKEVRNIIEIMDHIGFKG